MGPPEIFDRDARRKARDRAAPRFAAHDFVRAFMVGELLARLDGVRRSFATALELNAVDDALAAPLRARGIDVTVTDPGRRFAERAGGLQCDEDRLPFAPAAFDLVVSAGGLDSVNDLPGALAQIRRALIPHGLFMAALMGAPSLGALKASALAADLALGPAARARVHPQIEVRTGGDLLARAGFALPVADTQTLTARYGSLLALMHDLRGMGATNLLDTRRAPLNRAWLTAASGAFAARADPDGKIAERFEILFLTGWAAG